VDEQPLESHVGLLVRVRSHPDLAWHDGWIKAEDDVSWTVALDRPCTRGEWTNRSSSFAANGRVTFTRVNKQVETLDPGGLLEARLDAGGGLTWREGYPILEPELELEPEVAAAAEPAREPEAPAARVAPEPEAPVPPPVAHGQHVRWNESMGRTARAPAPPPVTWNESMGRAPRAPAPEPVEAGLVAWSDWTPPPAELAPIEAVEVEREVEPVDELAAAAEAFAAAVLEPEGPPEAPTIDEEATDEEFRAFATAASLEATAEEDEDLDDDVEAGGRE
jgi:hypothetical protein